MAAGRSSRSLSRRSRPKSSPILLGLPGLFLGLSGLPIVAVLAVALERGEAAGEQKILHLRGDESPDAKAYDSLMTLFERSLSEIHC